jgi:hypothetical protein
MQRIVLATLVLASFVVGCVTASTMVGDANAALAVGEQECVNVSLYLMSGSDLNKGAVPSKTVKVPAGWEVKGGGPTNMVICRAG